MNKDIKLLIEEIQKFDVSEYTEDDIISSVEIDNITYKNAFPGCITLIDILRKYDWSIMTNLDLQAEKACSGIIAYGNFGELYDKIKECLLSLKTKYPDDHYCLISFDDMFPRLPKKIIIEEYWLEGGHYTSIPCVISPCINGNISIKVTNDAKHNLGRRIRFDIRLIGLLKEFIKNYE